MRVPPLFQLANAPPTPIKLARLAHRVPLALPPLKDPFLSVSAAARQTLTQVTHSRFAHPALLACSAMLGQWALTPAVAPPTHTEVAQLLAHLAQPAHKAMQGATLHRIAFVPGTLTNLEILA